ncbi:amidase [Bacillus dakarensis]|uniref:amidase n=1 Tax=Robertmurraya dakarensis TaxID=1926278 RepID=UPI000980AD8E|nr:amidase [Bacillus dakarensis]
MNSELASKSITDLAPLIKGKEVSPVELTEAVLTQAEVNNGNINAYIKITSDEARQAAKKAEDEIVKGNYRGSLHGIPMALKDIFYFKDEIVTVGSKISKDFVPDFDATVVSKLKKAGVIFTGKLNLHEYAWGTTTNNPHYGACRNPWNFERIPGGSSGGSGAAVAANMTTASLGTDTGGSVRIPASACGIIGLKPTYGRVSKYGCFPLASSLDHIGPMTKTVHDASILLELIAGFDKKDTTTIDTPTEKYSSDLSDGVKDIVIGIEEDYFFKDVDSEVEKLTKSAIHSLERMGARIERVSVPSLLELEYAQMITVAAEAGSVHRQNLQICSEQFGEDVRVSAEFGQLVSAVEYLRAQQIRYKISSDFKELFNKIDVLISPTLPFIPPAIGSSKALLNGEEVNLSDIMRLTRPANLTGLPAISIPCGLSEGLPIGMQIIGAPFKESIILRVAKAFENTYSLRGLTVS